MWLAVVDEESKYYNVNVTQVMPQLCSLAALMSQKQPVMLNSPARKFFASQLLSCTLRQDGRIINQGLYSDAVINQVWVQGIVVLVSADGNDLLLDDGTAVIQATGVTKIVKDLFIHKGIHWIVQILVLIRCLYLHYIRKAGLFGR